MGARGEELACAYLREQGLRVLARNWRCGVGEIDIIAAEGPEDRPTLVFCEVKARRGLRFGHPLEAVTYAKLRTLRQLAAIWTREHGIRPRGIRIDAIGVLVAPDRAPVVTHVRAVG